MNKALLRMKAPQDQWNLAHPVFQGAEHSFDNALALGDMRFPVCHLADIVILLRYLRDQLATVYQFKKSLSKQNDFMLNSSYITLLIKFHQTI